MASFVYLAAKRGATASEVETTFAFSRSCSRPPRPPFLASNLYLLTAKILGEDAPPLRDLRDDVPPVLAAVVERCLVRDPEGRLRTMPDVAAALDGRLVLEPLPATMPTEGSGTRRAESDTVRSDPYNAITETMNPHTPRRGP